MRGYRYSLIFVLLLTIGLFPTISLGGGGPKNVLLVVNDNSPISQSIAAYYQQKREIPQRNICRIRCSTSEIASKTECENNIVAPIRSFIASSGLHDRLDYIVLTKGIPLKADYSLQYGYASVASILTCVGEPSITGPIVNPYGPTANPAAPITYFRHQFSFNGKSYYAVARLDAYNEADVHRMIDDALIGQPSNGLFLLDGKYYSSVSTSSRANDRLRTANHNLRVAGYTTYYDDTTFDSRVNEFVGGQQNVMGYFSWGSNESLYFTQALYISNYFRPGSIADTYVSTSGRTFTYPPDTGQSLIADLIPQGLSAGNGYVSEPVISLATFPNVLFSRYTQGYNACESFLAGTPELFWKAVFVGDPLMAPYATPPSLSITAPGTRVYGTATVSVSASDASGIAKVEFYLDDVRVATCTAPPYEYVWDTTQSSEGTHLLEVIAYENSDVFTQALATKQIEVRRSAPLDVSSISLLAPLPEGTYVRLTSKPVIAGSDAFTDCLYVSETDRSAGIKVLGTFEAATGSLVTVEGDLASVDGEKVIQATWVSDNLIQMQAAQTTSPSFKPLSMPNRLIANRGSNADPEYAGLPIGLSNVGLLIQSWGRVTGIGQDEFTISDGSLVRKYMPIWDLEVSLKNLAAPITMPPEGSFVTVIGVSCLTLEDGLRKPTIRPRSTADIVILPGN
jgi:uncharacterized protein (TIGR03790 family)